MIATVQYVSEKRTANVGTILLSKDNKSNKVDMSLTY